MIRFALLFLLLLATPARAQILHGNEYVAGAGLNLTLRGPWVSPSWRRTLPRFALSQAINIGYETLVDCNAWHAAGHKPWRDLGGRLIGYVATEAVVAVVHLVVR